MNREELQRALKAEERHAPDAAELRRSVLAGSRQETASGVASVQRRRLWPVAAVAACVALVAVAAALLSTGTAEHSPAGAPPAAPTAAPGTATAETGPGRSAIPGTVSVGAPAGAAPAVGTYELASIRRDGTSTDFKQGDPTLKLPTVIIRKPGYASVYDTCGSVSGPYTQSADMLSLGNIFAQGGECSGRSFALSQEEWALYDQWHDGDKMEVRVSAGTLTAEAAGVEFVYSLR